jgi:hypothetical protein
VDHTPGFSRKGIDAQRVLDKFYSITEDRLGWSLRQRIRIWLAPMARRRRA